MSLATPQLSHRLVDTGSRLLAARVSRRGFLVRATVVGSALAVDPFGYVLRPGSAYASVCGNDAGCGDGYTVFCCTVNGGLNACPPGTIAAGWWKADGAALCGGQARYFIDCNAECTRCATGCGSFCDSSCWACSCRCGSPSTCDQRRVCCNVFRYGQCHQEVGCVGPVACRMVSCTPPYELPLSCSTASATDNNTAGHSAPCLTHTPVPASIAVWRPSSGVWYTRGGGAVRYGVRGDVPVPADYTGDRRTEIAVWRPSAGVWYVRGRAPVRYGTKGDVPVPGDYSGAGRVEIAVWRPSAGVWYVRGRAPVRYGTKGDVPVPGDYSGVGRVEIAVWRPSTGVWYVRGRAPVRYGTKGDVPVPGDYSGVGRVEIAVWRPSTGVWYVRGRAPVRYGVRGDVPVPGDYSGAGRTEIALWRPSTGVWYVRSRTPVAYGTKGDIPVPGPGLTSMSAASMIQGPPTTAWGG